MAWTAKDGMDIDGLRFVDKKTRKRIPKVTVSDFCLLKRDLMTDGRNALTKPRLAEWHALAKEGGYDGPIFLRVFHSSHTGNVWGIVPTNYGVLPQTHDRATWLARMRDLTVYVGSFAGREFGIEWTGGDRQYIYPIPGAPEPWRGGSADSSRLQQTFNEEMAALVDLPNIFFDEINERDQNGNCFMVASHDFSTKCRILRSAGYYADSKDKWPFSHVRDYLTFHTSRTVDMMRWPRLLYDLAPTIAALHSYYGIPADLDEPYRFEETSDPAWAEIMGSFIAWCAGVCFHSRQGLIGDGFQNVPRQRDAAVRFFRGAASGAALQAL